MYAYIKRMSRVIRWEQDWNKVEKYCDDVQFGALPTYLTQGNSLRYSDLLQRAIEPDPA